MIFALASRLPSPSKSGFELTNGPSPLNGSSPPAGSAMTRRTGNSNAVANSKSRSSWAGTAMIAPVPYSIST